MRILRAGYEVTQQRMEDESKGVSPHDRKDLKDFDKRVKTGEFQKQVQDAKQSTNLNP